MDFETRWLEDFIALADTLSFSRAAERRFITQPAFSRRIKALETTLAVPLVDRSTTPVKLTDEGQLFLLTARTVMSQLRETVSRLRGLDANQKATLRVAAAHSLAFSFFPDWMTEHRAVMNNLTMRLVAMNVEEALHALREGQCDLLQIYYDSYATLQLDASTFPSITLGHTRLVPVSVPLPDSDQPRYSLDSDEQHEIPLLAYTPGAFLGRTLRLMLKQDPIRLRLKTVYDTAMAEGLKGMALTGAGIAWVPELCIRRELREKELVICGADRWHAPLEIRLYRCSLVRNTAVNRLWQRLSAQPLSA